MSAPPAATAKSKKRVMVVEDDQSVREMVVRALSTKYTVTAATNGLEASELLGSSDLPPDLLVCDVMMPKVDGFTFVKSIKGDKKFAAMNVIFLTAKTTSPSIVQGIQLGARHYIQKPFSIKDLVDKVDKLLLG